MIDDSPKALAIIVISALGVLIALRKTFGGASVSVG